MSSSSAAVISTKGPNLGQTFSAAGSFFKNPNLSNASALLKTGDPSLQKTADLFDNLVPSALPDPQFAGDAPNPGAARMDALRAQLAEEQKMRASATLFAGNTPSATPATAGQLLMGR